MLQLVTFAPALGAAGQGLHDWWWIVLAIVVFAFVMPMAYLFGHGGGRPGR
ncbi:MAG: hypothetical protein ACXVAN_00800 [Polyangia bacterium]